MAKRILTLTISALMIISSLTTTALANGSVSEPDGGYYQDFDDIAVGTSGVALAEETGLRFGGNGTVSVISDGGTNKLLLEGGTPPDKYNEVDYHLPQEITVGIIETSIKVSMSSLTAGAHAFLGVLNGTTNRGMLSVYGNWTYYTTEAGESNKPAPTLNSGSGMYHLRTVISREAESDNWTAELYDDGGDEPQLMYSTEISKSSHPVITGIRFANTWPMSATQKVILDDIEIDYDMYDAEPLPAFVSFEQDFENTTVEESGLIFDSYDGNGRKSIVTDNGTKKLLLEGGGAATTNDVYYYFPHEIARGAIETSLKAGFDVNAGIQAFLAVLNGTNAKPMISAYGTWTYYTTDAGEGNMPAPTLNASTNMYHLRTVVYREDESDNWTAELYDDGGDEPQLMYSTEISAVTYSAITGIKLANNWPMAAVQNVMLDDIKIAYYDTLEDIPPSEPEPEPEPEPEEPVEFTDFSQNFENISVEASELTFGGNGTASIITDSGTNKLLLEGGTPPDKYNEVDYKFPDGITKGIIETSLKAGFDDINAGAHAFLGVLNGTANRGILSAYSSWTYYTTEAGEGNMPAPTLNSTTNMYHLRTVIYRNNATDNWTAELYDDGGNEPKLMYTTEISSSTHPKITGIRLANTWPLVAVQKVMLDDILITYTETPYVESSDCEECEPTAESLTLNLSKELPGKDFELKISQKDDRSIAIDTTFVYDEEANAICIKLGSYLDYDTEYIVEFSGVQIQNYEFKTKEAPITLTNIEYLYGLDGGVTVPLQPDGIFSRVCDVTIERNDNTSDVLAILVSYGENGAISAVGVTTIGGTSTQGRITIDNLTAKTAKEFRAYVWEQNESGLHQVKHKIIN